MKFLFRKYIALVAALGLAGSVLAGDAVFGGKPFAQVRKEAPSKLEQVRQRLDAKDAGNLTLAFVLSVYSPDAKLVSSTVLAYQLHKGKPLSVLMASAAKNANRADVMQQVDDKDFKDALSQAPEEMEGISGTYQAVDNLLAMNDADFAKLLAKAHQQNPQEKAARYVQKSLQGALGNAPAKKNK